ncbi:MAG: efflux RND transporter periplasmic adaptor subunit [bacterium]|nr:efflux RND transporter periplasmic adaptor subunit [bacterium]
MFLAALLFACATDESADSPSERGGSGGPPSSSRGGPPGGFSGGGEGDRGVPVEVAAVARRPISSYLETHGTLEAENEVDLVARTAGPIVELLTEEGKTVREGDVLARIDDREIRAQLDVSRVRLEETRLAYERAKELQAGALVSQEALDQALANYQSAQGDFERLRVQMLYTEITAPFDGLVVERYVKFAEHLSSGSRLFRLSDFDPLLCPIQVPERELPRLRVGQSARLEVEAWGEEAFAARVLRLSPVVDAATGTVKVTLEVAGRGRLRPGMFASVYLEMERRPDALVIPKSALALDSLGDTVFVAAEGVAERRSLELGFQNENLLEVRAGLEEGEPVIVVGQDGLSEGTPVEILHTVEVTGERVAEASEFGTGRTARPQRPEPSAGGQGVGPGGPGGRGGPGGGRGFRDIDLDDPEQLERAKSFMRQRGLSDEEIEQRLKRMRERQSGGG